MSALPVTVAPSAQVQIEAAATWWEQHRSPEQAARWLRGIVAKIEAIGVNPTRFGKPAEAAGFSYEVRELLFGLGRRPTHRVLFSIEPDRVLVFAVRHVGQDAVSPDDL